MIGNTVIGKSFKGCVNYVMGKDQTLVLDESGVRSHNTEQMIKDFVMVSKQNPRVKNSVWHTSISFAHEDKVSNEMMKEIARDYLKKLDLDKSQYLIVRHFDTPHEHVHIVANRVRHNGETVNDQFSKNRTARACDELEVKYGLTVARNQSKVRENDVVQQKKVARSTIKSHVIQGLRNGADSWKELEAQLKENDIEIGFQVQSTGRVNGVYFRTKEFSFKGSAIDQSFSYGRLSRQLEQNQGKSKHQEL